MSTIAPLAILVIPAFVERAVTDAPFIAFVPISIFTVPVDTVALERFPRAIVPEPEIVILRVGSTRPVTTIPLMLPLALEPMKVSFQLIGEERAPLPTTVPVPICEAETREKLALRVRIDTHARSERREVIYKEKE